MRIFSGFTMFFYTVVFLAIGCGLILLVLNRVPINDFERAMEYLYNNMNLRISIGLVGLLIIMYSIVALQVALGTMQREKTIAFENPSGQVTISLSAIEDFIRRTSDHMPEVKELRANVTAGKKGINVINRAVIYSDTNIPEVTEKIQGMLKNKIQEMLGIEEAINVKIHIAKIVPAESPEAKNQKARGRDDKRTLFRGIEYGNT
ncbi:MAG: alkaline shock response membrane anchor protein AmaP [Candidatus Omnitrophica bacterium]|nr:alkaline shock response membrane anchor protein AmaP [Candidatus Omnitrophota bacterium]MBU4487772.1 alkaline shock response membrane anchor protein AmaP [Candidatus Omnitrophota bacterium]MCG2705182.1 alkaline shock response membrane anchor protein AmaP [Candidatus Omnitrophota bacterium]